MIKRVTQIIVVLAVVCGSLSAMEAGLTVGTLGKTDGTGLNYGISGGMGTIIPMLKFEAGLYRIKKPGIEGTEADTGVTEENPIPFKPNVFTAGLKFRPKFGRFAPYAIVGLGWEFEKVSLRFSLHNKFTFIGGGLHVFLMDMVSVRGDIRLLNFSEATKTRFSAGVFLHL
ncbi:MAG: porin family protein [bacterium]|nr:porin family protein [bacterium]